MSGPLDRSLLVIGARLVPLGGASSYDAPVALRIVDGTVTEVGPDLARADGEDVLDAHGRWAMPGLWDHHVHLLQWAMVRERLDLSGTLSADEVVARIADRLSQDPGDGLLTGFGHRSATWSRQPTVAELDAVSGAHPVVLLSGDGHHGWLNSSALALLGLPPRDGVVEEAEWYAAYPRMQRFPAVREAADRAYGSAVRDANGLGVVGVVDLEIARGAVEWPERVAAGVDTLRVRPACYPDTLDEVLAAGYRTHDPLPGGAGLVRMGPLKVISDGSLNTRTAYCHQPYPDPTGLSAPYGIANQTPDELEELMRRAHRGGLQVAVHALGDAAVQVAIDVITSVGATGSLEHVQLAEPADLSRMADAGIVASVQPAHLLDDRDVTDTVWPDRADRCFLLRSMLDRGVTLAMGSDAPVAPLDPWLAVTAAVRRTGDDRPAWHPSEAISASEALAASTDGWGTLAPGHPGDLVLLDRDPLDVPERPDRWPGVAVTVVGGRVVHNAR